MKTVHRTGEDVNFVREVTVLQQCSHPTIIISSIGLVSVVDDYERVEEMLIEYIDNAQTLRNVEYISPDDFEKWMTQIRNAVDYLHNKGLVWGDTKAVNILIRDDGNVLLIDFGGGHTESWVDKENYETMQGICRHPVPYQSFIITCLAQLTRTKRLIF